MTDSIEKTLRDLRETHGDFREHARLTQEIKSRMRDAWEANEIPLSCDQKGALEMIAGKIAGICLGNPDHIDHWHYIAAFATLVENRLSKRG